MQSEEKIQEKISEYKNKRIKLVKELEAYNKIYFREPTSKIHIKIHGVDEAIKTLEWVLGKDM